MLQIVDPAPRGKHRAGPAVACRPAAIATQQRGALTRRLGQRCALALAAVLALSTPALAQIMSRLDTPGTAFAVERGKAKVNDVGTGRQFRGEAFSTVVLRGMLRLPPSAVADPTMLKLVVHFRASPQGPSLRSVELGNGTAKEFHIDTDLRGDLTGETKANTWDFTKSPVRLYTNSLLHLEVQFPGGFDSAINPGEFVLTSVSVDFPRKLAAASPSTTLAGSSAQRASIATAGLSFPAPTIIAGNGKTARLDWCRVWGSECGKPAADAFCQSKGHPGAAGFQEAANIGNTAIISSKALCTAPSCDGFSAIECAP